MKKGISELELQQRELNEFEMISTNLKAKILDIRLSNYSNEPTESCGDQKCKFSSSSVVDKKQTLVFLDAKIEKRKEYNKSFSENFKKWHSTQTNCQLLFSVSYKLPLFGSSNELKDLCLISPTHFEEHLKNGIFHFLILHDYCMITLLLKIPFSTKPRIFALTNTILLLWYRQTRDYKLHRKCIESPKKIWNAIRNLGGKKSIAISSCAFKFFPFLFNLIII